MNIFDRYREIIANTGPDIPTVLEIGAGYGDDTPKLTQILFEGGRVGRYIAFEPDKRNFTRLLSMPCAGNIELVSCAIGDQNGQVPWHASFPHTLSGSVKVPKEHLKMWPQVQFSPPSKVFMARLDDVTAAKDIGIVDFIWCDVQGAEDIVIAGGQDTLKNTRFFYTECYDVELYEGQIGRVEIPKRLPGNWRVVEDYGTDVLYENLSLNLP
jgi:FkbM family methyltransferase